ncbi:MAG: hypothetical protein KDI83_06380 [Gammaproteobacteria bacterium]|nr:hypothetical protein [Gammaproteobacteria bacterium]
MVDKRVAEFREPDTKVWRIVHDTLSELKPVDLNEYLLSHPDKTEQDAVCLELGNCLNTIEISVIKDFRENIVEEPNESWRFSYVVEKYGDSVVNILTKLSSKEETSEGSIYYGLSVIRTQGNKYLMWSDYD